MASPSNPTETRRPVLNATRARQGRYGRPMFWVLVASTLLAALGLALAWAWKAPDLAAANSNNGPAKSPAAFQATTTPARQTPSTP
jgi:hypothetical protein